MLRAVAQERWEAGQGGPWQPIHLSACLSVQGTEEPPGRTLILGAQGGRQGLGREDEGPFHRVFGGIWKPWLLAVVKERQWAGQAPSCGPRSWVCSTSSAGTGQRGRGGTKGGTAQPLTLLAVCVGSWTTGGNEGETELSWSFYGHRACRGLTQARTVALATPGVADTLSG